MERPAGIVDFTPVHEHFPFESRWFDSSVGPVHFVDEGEGRPLLLLHGNPEWSFIHRRVIRDLRGAFRCVAMDYPGFGLSVHPAGYGYTPGEHAGVVRELVEHLDLADMVVAGHDWGGPIGLDVASRMPTRCTGLVMGNTWYWPADDLVLRAYGLLMGAPPLQWLITQQNAFVRPLMAQSLQVKLSALEFAHYVDVVPTPESRRGIAEFPRQVTAAHDWLVDLQQRVRAQLRSTPLLLVLGRKDPVLGSSTMRDRWLQDFPEATVLELPAAGHFALEDAPADIAAAIRSTFGR